VFTKGFGLVEALLALLLSCVILTAAMSCQWFARRSMQVALEHMSAVHLLIDIQQSTDFSLLPPGQPLTVAASVCTHCPSSPDQSARIAQRLMQQQVAAILIDPQLCVEAGAAGVQFVLSWQSRVLPPASQQRTCGSGAGRRQLQLGAAL
jgi:hypothetical protein